MKALSSLLTSTIVGLCSAASCLASPPQFLNPSQYAQAQQLVKIESTAKSERLIEQILPQMMPMQPGKAVSGRQMLSLLKGRGLLQQYSALYARKPAEFEQALLTDPTIRFDATGMMLHAEKATPASGATAAAQTKTVDAFFSDRGKPKSNQPAKYMVSPSVAARSSAESVDVDPSQAFTLNSNPGSQKTLYLDFKGATLSGTAWNYFYNIVQINAAPFDTDGDPNSFSDGERREIIAIWKRVAQFYAPFDINVTTQDPGQDAINRDGGSDAQFGAVMVFTKDFTNGQCGCGGVSFTGVFNSTDNRYRYAFVMTDAANTFDLRSYAAMHEFGHQVGLMHDGKAGESDYYGGYTDAYPELNWAPIMGNATPSNSPRNVIQFSKGEYSGATNTQDDFAVMNATGLALQTTSAPAIPAGGNWTVEGMLPSASSSHYIPVNAPKGFVRLDITRDASDKAMDVDAYLYKNGVRLGASDGITNDGPDKLSIRYDFQSNGSDSYYLYLTPKANPGTSGPGFSTYGSIGTYKVQSTYVNAPPPNLSVSGTQTTLPYLSYTWNAVIQSQVTPSAVRWKWSDQSTYTYGQQITRSLVNLGNYTLTLEAQVFGIWFRTTYTVTNLVQ